MTGSPSPEAGAISEEEDFSSASTDVSMMSPKTIMKAEKRVFWLNLALGMFIAMILRYWQLAIVQIVIGQFLAMWITSNQPDKINIYLKYRHQGDSYGGDPSPTNWKRNRRPEGFGRL
jgi:hypothetical protein